MDSIKCAKQNIRAIIAKSSVPEDSFHSENVLEWIIKLKSDADEALQIAALAHDIDRADEHKKTKRNNFSDYNKFKSVHAENSANILKGILIKCNVKQSIIDESCRLVRYHEVGGDPHSDLLKDADSISFFEINMPFYFQREGKEETLKRCIWGYNRLSLKMKKFCQNITYSQQLLNNILKETINKAFEEEKKETT